jgi:hypothetical protein
MRNKVLKPKKSPLIWRINGVVALERREQEPEQKVNKNENNNPTTQQPRN